MYTNNSTLGRGGLNYHQNDLMSSRYLKEKLIGRFICRIMLLYLVGTITHFGKPLLTKQANRLG